LGAGHFLAIEYESGQGVPQNDAEAVRWYRLADDQGVALAWFSLGNMYANGQGVPQDYAEALRLYRLAADQEFANAQSNLGLMYANGQGVPQDYAEAARWYRLAADQGLAVAQYNLGVMYRDGHGVPQDYVEAHMWYNLGAAQSSGEDRDRLVRDRNSVAERMTAELIAEAQRRAREWTPAVYYIGRFRVEKQGSDGAGNVAGTGLPGTPEH
jgi:TPR repeat protein